MACYDQPAGDFQFSEFVHNKSDSPVMIRGFRVTENSHGVSIEDALVMTEQDYGRLQVGMAAYGWPRQYGPTVEQIRAASRPLEGAVIPPKTEAVIVYHIRAEHPGWELRGVTLRYADAFLPRTRTSSSHVQTCPMNP